MSFCHSLSVQSSAFRLTESVVEARHFRLRFHKQSSVHVLFLSLVAVETAVETMFLSFTSVKIIKNEVGCRDETIPKTIETRRHCEED